MTATLITYGRHYEANRRACAERERLSRPVHLCPCWQFIVVTDSLPAHRVNGVKAALECVGAKLLYLPALFAGPQPDREKAFAKLKALLRKAAARTVDDLWAAIAQAKAFTPTECKNYFVSSGYDPQ